MRFAHRNAKPGVSQIAGPKKDENLIGSAKHRGKFKDLLGVYSLRICANMNEGGMSAQVQKSGFYGQSGVVRWAFLKK